jgi:hypothetical protein
MNHSDENKILRGNTSVADFAHHQLATTSWPPPAGPQKIVKTGIAQPVLT